MAIDKGRLANELLGVGSGGGSLEKLEIWYRAGKVTETIEALFNPSELGWSRSVKWQTKKSVAAGVGGKTRLTKTKGARSGTSAQQTFLAVDPAQLQIALFFDTYEAHHSSPSVKNVAATFAIPTNPFQSPRATDVTVHTSKLAALAKVQAESHQPPSCLLKWGRTVWFRGVLSDISVNYTMFMPDGMPVRATAECTFIEAETEAEVRRGEVHSADVAKSRTVRRHDTLHSLAAEEYNDPSLWRHIARANNIINPRQLKPGDVLIIPTLAP
jgi:nucleoid-associated protein YgaU